MVNLKANEIKEFSIITGEIFKKENDRNIYMNEITCPGRLLSTKDLWTPVNYLKESETVGNISNFIKEYFTKDNSHPEVYFNACIAGNDPVSVFDERLIRGRFTNPVSDAMRLETHGDMYEQDGELFIGHDNLYDLIWNWLGEREKVFIYIELIRTIY